MEEAESFSGSPSLSSSSEEDSATLPNMKEFWKRKIAKATAYVEDYLQNKQPVPCVKDLLTRLLRKTQEAHDVVMNALNDSTISELLLRRTDYLREMLELNDIEIEKAEEKLESHKKQLQEKAKRYLERRQGLLDEPSQGGGDGVVDRDYIDVFSDDEDDDNKMEKYANADVFYPNVFSRIKEVMRVLRKHYTVALGTSVVLIGEDFGESCLDEINWEKETEEGNDSAAEVKMQERLLKLSTYTKMAHDDAEKLFNDSLSFHNLQQQEWKEAAKLFHSLETSPYSALNGVATASAMAYAYCSILIYCVLELELEVAQKEKELVEISEQDFNLVRQINSLR